MGVTRVSLRQRPTVVEVRADRVAAVAVPVVPHPVFGPCLAVTRRSMINGHTGGRMSHAGDVVLFGGAVEDDETPMRAALRELCEESGTLHLLDDPGLRVRAHLGTWMTESGLLAEGYSVVVPEAFVEAARAEPREVAEIAYLRVEDVRAAPSVLEYHSVDSRDHRLGADVAAEFESLTMRVPHPVTGESWVLWGLAGFMVSQWVARAEV